MSALLEVCQQVDRLTKRVAELESENEVLQQRFDQRGEKMEVMRKYIRRYQEIVWRYLEGDHPEAADWFDADGKAI